MERIFKQIRRVWAVFPVLLLLFSACTKGEWIARDAGEMDGPYMDSGNDSSDLAVGTVRSRDGVRFIQLDAVSAGYVVNPGEIKDIADGTRVFLQYRTVVSSSTPDFCTDAILVEWASPLDVGEIRYVMDALEGDPVSIILDWITGLEDGFLTLHYSVPSKGKAQHGFALYPGATPYEYRLVHEAHGDTEGDLTEGIVCFPVGDLLPGTEDGTVTLTMTYLNIDHTWKTLTVEYRSPK